MEDPTLATRRASVESTCEQLREQYIALNGEFRPVNQTYQRFWNWKYVVYLGMLGLGILSLILIWRNILLAMWLGFVFCAVLLFLFLGIILPTNKKIDLIKDEYLELKEKRDKLVQKLDQEEKLLQEYLEKEEYQRIIAIKRKQEQDKIEAEKKRKRQYTLKLNKLAESIQSIHDYIYSAISTIGIDLAHLTTEIRDSFNLDVIPREVYQVLLSIDWGGDLIQKPNSDILLLKKDLAKSLPNMMTPPMKSYLSELDRNFENWKGSEDKALASHDPIEKFTVFGEKLTDKLLFSPSQTFTLVLSDDRNGTIVVESDFVAYDDEVVLIVQRNGSAAFCDGQDEFGRTVFFLENPANVKIRVPYNKGYSSLDIYFDEKLVYRYDFAKTVDEFRDEDVIKFWEFPGW